MSFTASVLIACAAFTAQAHGGGGERPLSAEEVAKLESKHLTNVRQATFGFFRAGEGYFSPDGKSIIFQAVPACRSRSSLNRARTSTSTRSSPPS